MEGAAARLHDLYSSAASAAASVAQAGEDQGTVLGALVEALVDATPESARARVEEATAAISALLQPGMGDFAPDPNTQAALVSLIIITAVALVARRLLGGSNPEDVVKAGMDEWASLAAAEGEDEPEELQQYDPKAIQEYLTRRPVMLLKRGIRSLSLLGSFGIGIYLDKKLLGDEPDEKDKAEVDAKRAAELRRLLVCLGPTYVKLGQVTTSHLILPYGSLRRSAFHPSPDQLPFPEIT